MDGRAELRLQGRGGRRGVRSIAEDTSLLLNIFPCKDCEFIFTYGEYVSLKEILVIIRGE